MWAIMDITTGKVLAAGTKDQMRELYDSEPDRQEDLLMYQRIP